MGYFRFIFYADRTFYLPVPYPIHKNITNIFKKIVFATKLNGLIPISLQPDGLNLRYFKFKIFDLTEFIILKSKVYDIGLQKYRS